MFYAPGLEEAEFQSVILTDFSLAILSILSVWIYMLIHLGSIFLATVGIFEVFVAFPVALFFYKLVFQVSAPHEYSELSNHHLEYYRSLQTIWISDCLLRLLAPSGDIHSPWDRGG